MSPIRRWRQALQVVVVAALLATGSLHVTAGSADAAICEWSGVLNTQLSQTYANSHATSTVFYQIGYACNTLVKSQIKVTKVVFYEYNPYAIDPLRLEDTQLYKTGTSGTPSWRSTAVTSCTPPPSGGCSFTATRTVNYTYAYSTSTYVIYGCACQGVGINGFWFGHRFIAHTGWTEPRDF
jgi:hypothetical protein